MKVASSWSYVTDPCTNHRRDLVPIGSENDKLQASGILDVLRRFGTCRNHRWDPFLLVFWLQRSIPDSLVSSVSRQRGRPSPGCPASCYRFGPRHVPLVAKRSRHVAVAIPEICVSSVVAVSPGLMPRSVAEGLNRMLGGEHVFTDDVDVEKRRAYEARARGEE
jgi:hypothetical protein